MQTQYPCHAAFHGLVIYLLGNVDEAISPLHDLCGAVCLTSLTSTSPYIKAGAVEDHKHRPVETSAERMSYCRRSNVVTLIELKCAVNGELSKVLGDKRDNCLQPLFILQIKFAVFLGSNKDFAAFLPTLSTISIQIIVQFPESSR